VWRCTPVFPSTWEVEAGGALEHRSSTHDKVRAHLGDMRTALISLLSPMCNGHH
jgi:hypothetical protein